MSPVRHFPNRDRLSVLTAVILLAYALTRFLDLPARTLHFTIFGSPLGFELNGPGLMLLLVAALISAGSDTLIRSHPSLAPTAASGRSPSVLPHWILPGVTALVLGAALNRAPNGPIWWLGLVVSALALLAVLVAEYIAVDPKDAAWDAAALALTTLTYTLALSLFALLYSLGYRAAISSSVGGLVAGSLAWRLFALRSLPPRRVILYAGLVGLVSAEVIWALSYWRVDSLSAALLTMVPFYASLGIARQHLAGNLSRRVWIEFAVVAAVGLIVALLYTWAGGR